MACNADGSLEVTDSNLLGTWKLTEAFISSGGPQYWVDVPDGDEFTFLVNGTFTTTQFPNCNEGSYFIEESELRLQYNCEEPDTPYQADLITYNLELKSGYFLATPTSGPICIEGCSYKFEKK